MQRAELHNKIHYNLALVIAFSFPFAKLTPIFIALMFTNWLIEGDLSAKIKKTIANKFALTFIILYTIHLIGLLYTENMKSGLFDIQVKLSIIIFPLLLSSKPFTQKQISGILSALLLACIYASLYMISRAISLYFTTGENAFFYQNFSVLLHPSYLSMYLNVVIVTLLLNSINNNIYFESFSILVSVMMIAFFSLTIVLLTSKSGIILLFLILITFLLYLIIYRKKYLTGIIITLGLLLSIASVYNFAPKVILRMSYLVSALKDENTTTTTESTTTRLLVWEAAQQVIIENFLLGVGTGDSKESLVKEYKKRNMQHAVEGNLNAHNTFYQEFITLGLVGFLILVITIFMPLLISIKTGDYLYASFLLIITFNFCFESMLETQAGVMFYAFFNSLLCFKKPEQDYVLTTL